MKKSSRILLFIASALLMININACKSKTAKTKKTAYTYSAESYVLDWQEVDKMEREGKGKALIEKTDKILERAVEEKNAVQIFKALAYRSKYIDRIEEDAQLKILTSFEKHTQEATEPLKSLLHSATAELYYQYFNQNRWRYSQRSEVVDVEEDDVRYWSLYKIQEHIIYHYRQSLQAVTALQSTPLESFKEILIPLDSNSFVLRPTLYDLLADRAFAYFKIDEGRISNFDKKIKKEEGLFLPTQEFAKLTFKDIDVTSNTYNVLETYKTLAFYHQREEGLKSVLLEREIERLNYAYSITSLENKDELYLEALFNLEKDFPKEYQAIIWFAQAEFYYKIGTKAKEKQSKTSDEALDRAMALCNKIEKEGNHEIAKEATSLKKRILQKSLAIELSKVVVSNKEIPLKINYKNYEHLYFRLYQLPLLYNSSTLYNANGKVFAERLEKYKIFKEWKLDLPAQSGYGVQQYTADIQGLDLGSYVLVASEDANFDLASSTFAFTDFQVSDLAYFLRNNASKLEVYARNREDGSAINQAKLQIVKAVYDYKTNSYHWNKEEVYTSDSKGYFAVGNTNSNYFSFYLTNGKDSLLESSNHYLSKAANAPNESIKSYLYTDRAIYRPGQVLHFKGIVIKSKGSERELQKNYNQTVHLYNMNGESVQQVEVRTNEYGSYYGSFTLPKGDLKGQYRIQDSHGNRYFSVEDYKRPTFEVVFDSINGNQQLNENVRVSGNIERFAGGNIGKTNIQYHIVRKTHFPYYPWYRPITPIQSPEEIANGELETEEDGSFLFEFFAEASANTDEKIKTIEHFEITIEATAANGEVQAGTKTIQLGQQSFYISTNIAATVDAKDLENLIVYAKNLEQKKVDQKLKLQLWKLEGDAENIVEYKKGSQLQSIDFVANQKVNLTSNLSPAAYLIEIEGEDKNGELIKYDQRFILYKEDSKQLAVYSKLWFQPLVESVEAGDEYAFLVGSSWKNFHLLYEIEHQGKIIHSEWLKLNQEQRKISLKVPQEYRGGFSIYLNGIQQNEFLNKTQNVRVDFSNKQLNLSLKTYRNLVEPGQKEQWELSISGYQGKKVDAEVLLGMYSQDLDAFRSHSWDLELYHQRFSGLSWRTSTFGKRNATVRGQVNYGDTYSPSIAYPTLNWYGFYMGGGMYYRGGIAAPLPMQMMSAKSADTEMYTESVSMDERVDEKQQEVVAMDKTITVRKDFRETAFFYPAKYNGKDGIVSFEFTMPDALTKWKFMALAHTQSLEVGKLEHSIQTQKQLMVFPNLPRFLREGDEFAFSSMLENNSEILQEGTIQIQFFDAISNQPIDLLQEEEQEKEFTLSATSSQEYSWNIKVPEDLKMVRYQIIAEAKNFSDGQEGLIPVLPRKQLITESLPLPIRPNTEKEFTFPNLLNMKEKGIQPTAYTVELTANPVWYAVQALPYLKEANTNNPEQVFHALFANSIAQKIVREQPKIKEVFDVWKELDSDELLSKLEQNQELKEILLKETPWLREAKNESEQKKRIALLFEANQMSSSLSGMSNQLLSLQSSDGGWPWFKSMKSNTYITSIIVEGFGLLKTMDINLYNNRLEAGIREGVYYLDEEVLRKYNRFVEQHPNKKPSLSANEIQYLYLRSMYAIPLRDSTAYHHYLSLAKKEWREQSMLGKAILATTLHRIHEGDSLARQILFSLKDHAIQDEEMGMYWKENVGGWNWYEAKIETQAKIIAAFNEVLKDQKSVEEMKIWLLKQKQVQAWEGSRATALAVYSLLMQGENLLAEGGQLTFKAGDKELSTVKGNPGTSYLKKQWVAADIQSEMGNIQLKNEGESIAWGAAYLQYYQDFDKIEGKGESSLKVSKALFKVIRDSKGKKVSPIDRNKLQLGDRVLVQLKIEVDRDMEFVHLKDQAVAAFEPTTTLSVYRSQDGLFYYQSVSDASTDFFFDYLAKGNYVFEYEVRVTQLGDFGSGSAVLQSYYAPEFKSYSKARRVKVEE